MAKYSDIAREMEKSGRYGDSRLVHINEAELAGIASLAPGGKLTTNPDTGLPEAFLPFLAPILGAVAGKAFLPAIAAKVGIGALTPALAGALGSGLATGLAENSLEKGLLAGITGFGLGSALGAAGGAGAGAAKAGVQKAAEEAAKGVVGDVSGAAAEAGLGGAINLGAGYAPSGPLESLLMGSAPSASAATQAAMQSAASPQTWGQVFQSGISDLGNMGSNLGGIGSALMQPGTMLPISYGLGALADIRAMDARKDAYNRQIDPSVAQGQRFRDTFNQSLGDVGRIYGFQEGGITSVDPAGYQAMRADAVKFANGGSTVPSGTPGQRQAALRGPFVNAPPEGYRPGFDPEFNYFSREVLPTTINPEVSAPAQMPADQGAFGTVPQDIVNRYRQIARDLGNFHVQRDLSGRNIRNRQQYLPEFTQLRTEYPGLTSLDAELMIDPEFQSVGFDPIGGNLGGGIGSLPALGQFQQQQGVDPAAFYQNILGASIPPSELFMGSAPPRVMAEGGMTSGSDEMVAEVVEAILGQHENGDAVISMFVEKHGPEVFAQLRSQVLQGVVPGAQTEGQMKGDGGGMDDRLMGMIGSSQPVALSTDEFVVPADVVSALGDGSSDAGAKVLYDMMDSVRRYKGGKTEQPPKMNPETLEKIKLGRP